MTGSPNPPNQVETDYQQGRLPPEPTSRQADPGSPLPTCRPCRRPDQVASTGGSGTCRRCPVQARSSPSPGGNRETIQAWPGCPRCRRRRGRGLLGIVRVFARQVEVLATGEGTRRKEFIASPPSPSNTRRVVQKGQFLVNQSLDRSLDNLRKMLPLARLMSPGCLAGRSALTMHT